MSMKKQDLARQLELKVEGARKGATAPGRFGQGATEVVERREQRRRDSAAGLVPFACKLPSELAQALRDKAAGHEGGLNALVAELLARGLRE